MKNSRYLLIFLLILLIIFSYSCTNEKSYAIMAVQNFIYAYSQGNAELLKRVISSKLSKNLGMYKKFFKSREFQKIKKEMKNFRLKFYKVKRTDKGLVVTYLLYFSMREYWNDVILVVKEGKQWKVNETGIFVFR